MTAPAGPFGSESEVLALPAVRATLSIPATAPGRDAMAGRNLRMLMETCAEAGVELGAFDRRKLAWLSLYEPQTVAVFAGIISRAHEAGKQEGKS